MADPLKIVTYVPMTPPPDENLSLYMRQELQKISDTLRAITTAMPQVAFVQPLKAQDGQQVYAKAPWDPGNGDGLYIYHNGAWTWGEGDVEPYVPIAGNVGDPMTGGLEGTTAEFDTSIDCPVFDSTSDAMQFVDESTFDSNILLTGHLKTTGDIFHQDQDAQIILAGGNGASDGGAIVLNGSTHTNANDIIFRVNGSMISFWDDNQSRWDWDNQDHLDFRPRVMLVNTSNADYTLVVSDSGKINRMHSMSADREFTVNDTLYEIGDSIEFYRDESGVAHVLSVTMSNGGSLPFRVQGQATNLLTLDCTTEYGHMMIIKIADDNWFASGDIDIP